MAITTVSNLPVFPFSRNLLPGEPFYRGMMKLTACEASLPQAGFQHVAYSILSNPVVKNYLSKKGVKL